MTNADRFASLQDRVFDRLIQDLDPRLCYHDINHTRSDVMPAVERLAKGVDVTENDQRIVMTAALLHDLGFVEKYEGNEAVAAGMAAEMLPEFGYTPGQIDTITGIILATRVPQAPRTTLQAIMCDADLDALGRKDFFVRSMLLRQERCEFLECVSLRDWLEFQVTFLRGHEYFLDVTKSLRDEGKARNLEELKTVFDRVSPA